MGIAPLVLALFVSEGAPAAPTPTPPPVVRYRMVERTRSLTPLGERISALAATVTVAGESARLEAETGTLPRTTASVALAGSEGFTLLDPKQQVEARATAEQVQALFTGSSHGPAMGSVTYRDVEATVVPEKAGKDFQGQPSRLYRVSAGWTLVVALPGRVSSVRTRITGTIVAAEVAGGRSAFDDLSRLFGAEGEVLAAVVRELGKVRGLPVVVELETVSDFGAEVIGGPAPEGGGAPPSTKTSVKRTVSELTTRAALPADAALFRVPEGFRSRGIEGLLREGALLP